MLKHAALIFLSLISSFANADGSDVFNQVLETFNAKWKTALTQSKSTDPKMRIPSYQIAISFTFYQFDIPTLGLKSVEYYDGKVYIGYANYTSLVVGIERKYNIPPHLWEFNMDTGLGCLMSPLDKVPPEFEKTSKEFKEIRKYFWRGVDWTNVRKRDAFNIYQMHRNYVLLEPNLAYIIRQGGNTEAVTMQGTIDSAVFTKIADSIRYRPNIQIQKFK